MWCILIAASCERLLALLSSEQHFTNWDVFKDGWPRSMSVSCDGLQRSKEARMHRQRRAEKNTCCQRETWDWVWAGLTGGVMGHVFDVVMWVGELPVVIGKRGRQQTDCITWSTYTHTRYSQPHTHRYKTTQTRTDQHYLGLGLRLQF